MYRIIADSSCDVRSNEFENFRGVPLLIYTEEKQFLDNGSIQTRDMLDYLEKYKGRSYTSCPGVESWIDQFENSNEIYIITITSGLSGTYNSALIAKDMYLENHPDAKVEVFDSLSTGPEMKMAVEKIIELKEKGLAFHEVCQQVKEYLDNSKLLFVLQSVHNLAQNGRINKVLAQAVGVLGISVIGFADEAGRLKQIGKARGDKKIVGNLLKYLEDMGYKGKKIRLCHVENEKLAKLFAHAIKEKYGDVDIDYYKATGLCSYYAERGGIILGFEG